MLTAAFIFNIALTLVLPVGLALGLILKDRRLLKPVLLGVAVFTVFQLLTRVPLLQLVLSRMVWYAVMTATMPLATAVFLGLSAALFEEGGRFLAMRLFMRQNARFTDGFAFGVGHGGWEAAVLVGDSAVAAFFASPAVLTPEALLVGGLERLAAMACQAAFSLLVLRSASGRGPWGFWIALLAHTLLDMFAVLSSYWGLGLWAVEAVIFACGAAALVYILYARRGWDAGQPDTAAGN